MTTSEDVKEEFHDKPIPIANRLGFKEPALVWSGFGIAYICAVIGGLIQKGLGTTDALLAILLGNLILFVYSSLIGYSAGKWGLNFPLMVKAVFGRKGAVLPILIMAVLVTGWYAFQAWLTADILRVAFGLESGAGVGLAGAAIAVIMGLPVIFGIKWMANLMKVALPLMVLFALYFLVSRVLPAGSALFESQGDGSITFWTGVGMAWSTFVVSGTMTGDIVRYTRSGGQAVSVMAVAFVFSNAPFMMIGALIAAAITDPAVVYFMEPGAGVLIFALAGIAILSNWSTCDACLYNAAMGFSNAIPGIQWRTAAMIGTIIGVVAAATGIIGNIVNWLILIGLVVPPIGGAIIADYFVIRGDKGFGVSRTSSYNVPAIIAALAGLAVGAFVNQTYPSILFGLPGIVTAFVVYVVLAKMNAMAGADLSAQRSGAEAG